MEKNHIEHCDLDLLSAAVDGDLTDDQKISLEAHIGECEHCRETLHHLRDLSIQVRNLTPVKPPVEVLAGILQGFQGGEKNRLLGDHEASESPSNLLRFPGRMFLRRKPVSGSDVWWKSIGWLTAVAAGVALVFSVILIESNHTSNPHMLGIYVSASHIEQVAGLDLVVVIESGQADLQGKVLSNEGDDFLIESNFKNGVLRISMASPEKIDVIGRRMICSVPIQGESQPIRAKLQQVRIYRPDGSSPVVGVETEVS